MQFRNFAENLLGSKVKIKLLKYLVSEGAITSEREIGRTIGVSPGAINKTLKELHDLNLVCPTRIGNVTAWQLNEASYAYLYLAEFLIKLKNREDPLSDLKNQVSKSLAEDKGLKKAIIFGSVAESRELPESDIDLFILAENETAKKSIMEHIHTLETLCLERYGNRLSAQIFTSGGMKNTGNKKLLENVMNGIRVIDR